uniref:Uncharacterized protein n=1 Tax=viral metagenome TaxID=1070528 RepID=A0A6M3J7T2_9ZZZZ
MEGKEYALELIKMYGKLMAGRVLIAGTVVIEPGIETVVAMMDWGRSVRN